MKATLNHRRLGGEVITETYWPGQSFTWSGAANYSHGCEDSATFQLCESGQWLVTAITDCGNCWQVGHDNDHSCGYVVGQEVSTEDLPTDIL